jgi:ribulose-phosphate 3-epimerase
LIRHHNVNAGVVINPATPVQMLENVLDMVDHVLVMSVNPGFGGQKFIPVALEKTRRLVAMRGERRLDFRIEMDGGIASDTIAPAVRAGVEILVAGNAVFAHGDPKENAQTLLKMAQEATLQRV